MNIKIFIRRWENTHLLEEANNVEDLVEVDLIAVVDQIEEAASLTIAHREVVGT